MTLGFELFSAEVGRYRFRIIAASGHIVAVSGPYESKAAVKSSTATVRTGAPRAAIHDSTRTPAVTGALRI